MRFNPFISQERKRSLDSRQPWKGPSFACLRGDCTWWVVIATELPGLASQGQPFPPATPPSIFGSWSSVHDSWPTPSSATALGVQWPVQTSAVSSASWRYSASLPARDPQNFLSPYLPSPSRVCRVTLPGHWQMPRKAAGTRKTRGRGPPTHVPAWRCSPSPQDLSRLCEEAVVWALPAQSSWRDRFFL